LGPSTTELLFSVGLDHKTIIAIDTFSDYPKEVNTIENRISLKPLGLEQIISLEPDLIIGADIIGSENLKLLEDKNLKTIIVGPSSLEGILRDFKMLSIIFNRFNNIEDTYNNLKQRKNSIKEEIETFYYKPKVYMEYYPYWSFGPDSLGNNIINLGGGKNICNSLQLSYSEVNSEFIIAKNPDIIFYTSGKYTTTTKESICDREGWSAINAVKNHNIFILDDDSLSRPTLRTFDVFLIVHEKIKQFMIENDYITTSQKKPEHISGFHYLGIISFCLLIIIKKKYRLN